MHHRMVLARVGWDELYDGNNNPTGGGSFNEREPGWERFNFEALGGFVYGYFKPARGKSGHERQINLGRIERGFLGESLPGVLVVFFATSPSLGRQRVVGWYSNAAVYRRAQADPSGARGKWKFFLKASCKDTVLLPVGSRDCLVPKGKGSTGQSNVCYMLNVDGSPREGIAWADEVSKFIEDYAGDSLLKCS